MSHASSERSTWDCSAVTQEKSRRRQGGVMGFFWILISSAPPLLASAAVWLLSLFPGTTSYLQIFRVWIQTGAITPKKWLFCKLGFDRQTLLLLTCLASFVLQGSILTFDPAEKAEMARQKSCCRIRGSISSHLWMTQWKLEARFVWKCCCFFFLRNNK